MKPGKHLKVSIRLHSVHVLLTLVALLACSTNLLAQKETVEEGELWNTAELPASAVWRYGATDRNPKAIGAYALAFSSDGKKLAVRDRRQHIRVLNIEEQKLQALIASQSVYALTFSPDDKYIVSGNRNTTQLWNASDGELIRELKQPSWKLAKSHNPPRLILMGKGTAYDYPWPLPSKPKTTRTKLEGRTVLPAGTSEDGSIAVFHNGGKMEILSTVDGAQIVPPNKIVAKKVIISPNDNLMAQINYGDKILKVFDLRDAKKYGYRLADDRRIVTAAFSSDSRFLYSSNYDHSIVIWDLVTMKAIDRIEGHAGTIYALASSPQLFCLASGASGASDRSVIFWNFRDHLFPEIDGEQEFLFDRVWTRMGSDDPKESLAATNLLYRQLQRDESVMDLLTKRLGLYAEQEKESAKQWIEDLDDRKFQVRENATRMLKAIVSQIRPMLERELKDGSQEAKWRIQKILKIDQLKPSISTPAGRREHRVILALELLGDANAIRTLELVSQKTSNQNLVNSATLALQRLKKNSETQSQ